MIQYECLGHTCIISPPPTRRPSGGLFLSYGGPRLFIHLLQKLRTCEPFQVSSKSRSASAMSL
jgi:hypothetical protein